MQRRSKRALAGLACALVGIGWGRQAAAEVSGGASDTPSAASEREDIPRRERARVDLGLSIPSGWVGGVGAGGAGVGGLAGGVGALGAWLPQVEAAFELELTGPLWLVMKAYGSYATDSSGPGTSARAWSLGGDVGARLEAPLFDWLEAGGHVLAGAAAAEARGLGFESSSWALRGVAGVGAHLRPTDFFGVRLSLDLLSGGYASASGPQYAAESAFVRLTATPRVELTFTF